MSEIAYQDLDRFLGKLRGRKAADAPAVWLLFGEDMLVERALRSVRDALCGQDVPEVDYEAVEGLNENVKVALERVNTYSLLSGGKVVALTGARMFQSRQNADHLWEQAARAGRTGDLKKAARYFLDILSLQNLTLEDVADASAIAGLRPPDGQDQMAWIAAVRDHCRQNGLTVPAATDPQQVLQAAIERGFPPGQHLIVATETVDKRRTLFKVIREKGLVVDCSVPQGDRQADRLAQEAVLNTTVEEGLRNSGKQMDAAARRALFDLTGFDLRTVAADVEKLVHFTGERVRIGVDDVRRALERTRRDPLYAFTEAVASRQLSTALFYLESLLTGGDFDHPLPLLAAVANQMRRLLVAKDFVTGPHGRVWHPGCTYPQFQHQVLPAVQAFDNEVKATLDNWEQSQPDATTAENAPRGKKRKAAPRSDLLMGGPGRSPYPTYKMLQKAERFTRAELVRTLMNIADADRRLKRSGASGRMVLEQLLFSICLGGEDSPPGRRSANGGREGRDDRPPAPKIGTRQRPA